MEPGPGGTVGGTGGFLRGNPGARVEFFEGGMDDEMDVFCCNHMCVCLSLSYFMVVDCYPHIAFWITSNSSCSHAS